MSGRALALVLAGPLLAGVAAGCGPTLYERTTRDWTRYDEAWEDFESRVFMHATLKSEPFRRAYVDEYARLFDLNAGQKEQLLAGEMAEHATQIVVVIAMATNQRDWRDIDPGHGIWAVRLDSSRGEHALPTAVRELSLRNPTWHRLFPHVGDQDVLWELHFDRLTPSGEPLVQPGDTLTLVVAGAPAQLRLEWRWP